MAQLVRPPLLQTMRWQRTTLRRVIIIFIIIPRNARARLALKIMMGLRLSGRRATGMIMMGSRLTRALARRIMMGSGLSIIITPHRLIIKVVKVQDLATQYADMMKSLSQGIGPFGLKERLSQGIGPFGLNDETVH